MTEEVKPIANEGKAAAPAAPVAATASRRGRGPAAAGRGQGGPRGGGGGAGGGRDRRGGGGRGPREPREFEQRILELARVTRVTKGGKRMRFRATLVIGDRRGRVGYGVAKGGDVSMAIEKAFRQAKKNIIRIPMKDETLPHAVRAKFAAADVLIQPAPQGTGLKSGGPTRVILELGGVPNASTKVLGAKNKINNAKATFKALSALKLPVAAIVQTETKAPEVGKK